ncbi:sugar kinase [Paenibacillus sp. FSL L8-0340]|uniref:carbohydrate kinase family protein n=1 Tax=Paenibacillus sp. FSL L8-0340 TaxID=2954685 RepID=UPI00315825D5
MVYSFNFNQAIDFSAAANDVLAVGELLVDLISDDYDEEFQSSTYHKFFGGSPANIAMNARKLGIHSQVAAAVGEDGLGLFLVNELRNAGIEPHLVERLPLATSMVLVTKSKSSPIPIFYRGADHHLSFQAELEDALMQSKILHFSCWPISMLPSRHTMESLIETARKNQILIGFDPNYHPMIWNRNEDGIEYLKSIIGMVDIIKPSEDDAERLFGRDTPENQVHKILNLGAKLVIMTLGENGAIVSNGKETVTFGTLATEVVDTTGAGDAFWSGFYSALVKGFTIRQALSLGFAVSAYKLKFTGAVVDLPKLEAIKELYSI